MSNLKIPINAFLTVTRNWAGPNGSQGVVVAVGASNVKGAWVNAFGGTLTKDAYALEIMLWDQSTSNSGQVPASILDVGVDPAGGTTYTTVIPNLLVAFPRSSGGNGGPGPAYTFPLAIKSGSSVALRAASASAAPGNYRARVAVYQDPTRPEAFRCGSWVSSVGVVAASSRGTLLPTAADARNDSAWVSLGSLSEDAWYVQPCVSMSDAAFASNDCATVDFAVGNAGSKDIFIKDLHVGYSTTEEMNLVPKPLWEHYRELKSGSEIFARLRTRGNNGDPDLNAALFYMGG